MKAKNSSSALPEKARGAVTMRQIKGGPSSDAELDKVIDDAIAYADEMSILLAAAQHCGDYLVERWRGVDDYDAANAAAALTRVALQLAEVQKEVLNRIIPAPCENGGAA